MHPKLFELNFFGLSLPLHTYGLMIATGFLIAMMLSARQATKEHEDADRIVDMAFYVLLAGLLGARVIFIITKWDDYMRNPIEILMFWRGGLVWYGGFIGAALFLIFYSRRYKINFFKYADILVPYMALAHAIGRFGCLAAGCCHGKPTESFFGISFPADSMAAHSHQVEGLIAPGVDSLPVHPTQLYEAGAEFLLFLFLLWIRRAKVFHGQILLVWLGAYPVIRSIIEMFRGDKGRGVYILSTSQYISIGIAMVAIVLYFKLRQKRIASEVSA